MAEGRNGWENKLREKNFSGKKIWFHCASLGEFEQGRPLIESIKKKYPNYSIIVTFFSSSGYEVRKDYDLADHVCYLPFDGRNSSMKFIALLRPDMAIFIKYEFWYYYLHELKKQRIPTFSVSAIFRPDQQFFKKDGSFFREMLSCFDHFFVQNMQSKELLNNQGFENVSISGDTRFDRVMEICSNPRAIERARIFKGDSKVMVIGSSWHDDIEVLLPIINDHELNLKYIIAPHEIGGSKISKLCAGLKANFQLFSKADTSTLAQSKVLVIDNIGMLSSLYQYGEIAYIGGAFGAGLHNILEAATFGMPIIFGKGKENSKYQEATDLIKNGGAFEVSDSVALKSIVTKLINDAAELKKTSNVSREYVISKTGAAKMIMDFLTKYF